MSNTLGRLNVKNIAIIGAGPSGLAAARYLLAEAHFTSIDIYEQRSTVGGVWNYNPAANGPDSMPLPQEDPDWDVNASRSNPADLVGPLYDDLETNIPRGLMGFSDHSWPSSSQLFPRAATVQEYLETYSAPVRHLISFNTRVTSLLPLPSSAWSLTTVTYPSSSAVTKTYDAVILANGHFSVPSLPPIPGLSSWAKQHPGSITHSMFYHSPKPYASKRTLVIGNGASGTDIASHLVPVVTPPLLHSFRSETYFTSPAGVLALPALESLDPASRTVNFVDGTKAEGVDKILFCTGYFYSMPFLYPGLLKGGEFHTPLYKHFLHRERPTLAVLAAMQRIIPFPIAEAQGAVLARLWSGRLPMPGHDEMEAWEKELLNRAERGRDVHVLGFPKDADYLDDMFAWAAQAGTGGKTPPKWGEKERWLRERFPEIKKAFAARGEARKNVKTLEELDFDFQQWKKEQEADQTNGIDSIH